MRHLKKAGIAVIAYLALLAGGFWLFAGDQIRGYFSRAPAGIPSVEEIRETIDQVITPWIEKGQSLPPPLRAPSPASAPKTPAPTASVPSGTLTRSGVIAQTNKARTTEGLPALKENSKLNRAAELKLNDMFAKQYFAHVSPSGAGPSAWIEEVGYAYLASGENLAEGNFESDKALIEAWMASPGHRANILKAQFTEIGVAVKKGMFEGHTTYLAVQMFGRPRSACPASDDTLRGAIARRQDLLQTLEGKLKAQYSVLEEMSPKHGEPYREEVEKYNALVAEYNALVAEVKKLVETYNAQVVKYNECAAGG